VIEAVSKAETPEDVVHRLVNSLPATLLGSAVCARLRTLSILPTIEAAKRCGEFFQALGFISHAETLFDTLALSFPDRPAGLVGLAQIAMHRKHWKLALTRWDALMSKFPRQKNFYWLTAYTQALEELGRSAEATVSLAELTRNYTEQPLMSIGKARSDMKRGHWAIAIKGWDELLAAFPDDRAVPSWKLARATALIELGRYEESEPELRHLIQADPWMLPALHTLIRCYCMTGRYAEALNELQSGIFADAELPVLFPQKMQILMELSQFEAARAAFSLYMQHAGDQESLEILFTYASPLHEGSRLTEIHTDLLRRLDALSASATVENTASGNTLRERIKLALKYGFQANANPIGNDGADQKVESRLRNKTVAVYDKFAVIQEVRRLLPTVEGIAVTGSAAYEGSRFVAESDIDVVAIYSKNGFAWGRVDGRVLEIQTMRVEMIKRRTQNPQHQLTNWVWNTGKVGGAEVLWGPSLENLVRSQITARTRLVAGTTLIGELLNNQHKAKSGSRLQSLDVPLVLTALRRVVSDALPIRAEADSDLVDFTVMSDFTKELENALILGEQARDILCNNDEVQKIMYWSAHRTALEWLRRAMGINLEMPEVGCLE
jgi:tetratricopeptide (TPR) repeat protein